MARFNMSEADKYGGQGGGGYFSLKRNHDIAKVRFLYDSSDDVEAFSVHELTDESGPRFSKKNVSCLRDGYGSPIDDCPFCKKGYPTKVKYFVPLYNIDTERVEMWERGKKFGAKLSALCSRYPHLVSHMFEIERIGEPGDQATSYEIYETGADESKLEDFAQPKDPLGTLVLEKSAEEMQYYIDRGIFPDDNGPVRRTTQTDVPVRRTPANTERREVF